MQKYFRHTKVKAQTYGMGSENNMQNYWIFRMFFIVALIFQMKLIVLKSAQLFLQFISQLFLECG